MPVSNGVRNPWVLAAVLIAVVALCCNCGGNNNRGGGVIELFCLDLAGAAAPMSGEVGMQAQANASCGALDIDLIATDVTDVFSVAATIEYDPSVAAFFGATADGSVLTQDGAQVNLLVEEITLGTLTVGAARNAADGIDVMGTGKLLTLIFIPVDTGDGDITITTPCVTGSEQPPVPKAGVACSGGMTVVTIQ